MKKKILPLIAGSFMLAAQVLAQGNDPLLTTEVRNSNPYHHIYIAGEMNVTLVQDETHGATVEGTDYQVGNLSTILHHDTLFVFQANVHKSDAMPVVTIHVNTLVSLEVSGKSKVDCSGLVNADYLTIKAIDGAQIKLEVRALKVDSKALGHSYIDLSGSVGTMTKSRDNSGTIDTHLLDAIDKSNPILDLCMDC